MSDIERISVTEIAELRRAAEQNPTMAMPRIEAALRGQHPVDPGTLDDDAHTALLLGIARGPLTPQAQAFYDKMAADGLGVGMTEDGTLVYGANEPV